MNLFKNLRERFKAQNREAKAVEQGNAVEAKPEAKPKGPPPFVKHGITDVPLGYVLPLGEVIGQPFCLTFEAGVRWHPDWAEPRITVNLWRIMPLGDALGWSGLKVLTFKSLLDADVAALAQFHGQTVTPESRALLDKMGLTIPVAQQPYSAFNTFRQGH
jgi:hypothetical protein